MGAVVVSTDESARLERLTRLGYALHKMLHNFEAARENAAKSSGMHPTDFACIGYLARQTDPVSPKDTIAQLGLTSGSGTALLDRLEKSGYIRRAPNPADRRSLLIVLDRDAAAVPIKAYERVAQAYRSATADLSDRDLVAVADFLETFGNITADIAENVLIEAFR
jgi:DNA-binding MarR family transcriptional regulator